VASLPSSPTRSALTDKLAEIERRHNLFPELDYRVYA